MKYSSRYQLLPRDDEHEVLGEELPFSTQKCVVSLQRRLRLLIVSNILLVSIILALVFVTIEPKWSLSTINKDIKRTSYYTPLLDDIEIPIETVQHDNTVFAHTKYTQPPSPEVDELWNNLTHPRLFLVNDETIRRIGKDPEYTVRHPQIREKHITYLAVHHQLHCLNDIRRNLFADYYYPHGSSSVTHMDHLQHCIDLLRQTLMCNANLDLITFNWWELTDNPQPDFKVNMKCRNWDVISEYVSRPFEETGIFRWYEQNWMDGWERQGGERNVTIEKKWWEIALEGGNITPDEFDARWGE